MEKASSKEEFSSLWVKEKVKERVDVLKDLVSEDKGVTVKGYDAIACGIEIAIKTLKTKLKKNEITSI